MAEHDTSFTSSPVCPKCGAEDQDWWDGLKDEKYDGDSWTASCPGCGFDYQVTMCVETTFSTEAAP